jgi:hypothetical protein
MGDAEEGHQWHREGAQEIQRSAAGNANSGVTGYEGANAGANSRCIGVSPRLFDVGSVAYGDGAWDGTTTCFVCNETYCAPLFFVIVLRQSETNQIPRTFLPVSTGIYALHAHSCLSPCPQNAMSPLPTPCVTNTEISIPASTRLY